MNFRDCRISARSDVLIREVGDESVLLNLTSESYFGLDPVGTRIWMELTTCPSIADAFDKLLLEFDVQPDSLRADILTFVSKLREAGLIDVVNI
jgi:hypothetical protein